MSFDVWDVVQQLQINELRELAGSKEIRAVAGTNRSEIELLNRQVAALTLINRAMWELMESKLGVTQAQLAAKVSEIDLRDGVADGRFVAAPTDCPQCQAKVCRQLGRCLFCGYRPSSTDVFDTAG
jgi:hypothetical protein